MIKSHLTWKHINEKILFSVYIYHNLSTEFNTKPVPERFILKTKFVEKS